MCSCNNGFMGDGITCTEVTAPPPVTGDDDDDDITPPPVTGDDDDDDDTGTPPETGDGLSGGCSLDTGTVNTGSSLGGFLVMLAPLFFGLLAGRARRLVPGKRSL